MPNIFENMLKFIKGINSSSNMQANDGNANNDAVTNVDSDLIDVSWAGYATK